jgi:CopG antitoxin of type II toxin-antitoxin system
MKKLSSFKNEDEERKFWATADSTKYIGWSQGKRKKLIELKPSLRHDIPSTACGNDRRPEIARKSA